MHLHTHTHSFIPDIYIAPLQETYSEALSVQLRSKRNVINLVHVYMYLNPGSPNLVMTWYILTILLTMTCCRPVILVAFLEVIILSIYCHYDGSFPWPWYNRKPLLICLCSWPINGDIAQFVGVNNYPASSSVKSRRPVKVWFADWQKLCLVV